jgi:hypothetical protein
MYKKLIDADNNTVAIRREVDDAFIPPDPENVDFRAFEQWVAEGNQPEVVSL